MRIITLETLKTMPNGTVFCPIDVEGNLSEKLQIITGSFKKCIGFNRVASVCPICAENEFDGRITIFDECGNKNACKEIRTTVEEYFVSPKKTYEDYKLFALFSKSEVANMIKVLQWALSDFEDDFNMDEVIKE